MDEEQIRGLERMAKAAIRRTLNAVEGLEPAIITHLFFCLPDMGELRVHLAFRDRSAREVAETSGHQARIESDLVAALKDEGYPPCKWVVDFVSVEEVDAAGGPWKYFR